MELIVKYDQFEGPLDLLLDLIKRREMNILELQISILTNDYLASLQDMKENQIELTSDFMEMAALLLEIKTNNLFPKTELQEELEDEFIQNLMDYQAYKEAIQSLEELKKIEQRYFPRGKSEVIEKKKETKWASVIERFEWVQHKHIEEEKRRSRMKELLEEFSNHTYTVEEQMNVILTLTKKKPVEFTTLFHRILKQKFEKIVSFSALLELIKANQIEIQKVEKKDGIHLNLIYRGGKR